MVTTDALKKLILPGLEWDTACSATVYHFPLVELQWLESSARFVSFDNAGSHYDPAEQAVESQHTL